MTDFRAFYAKHSLDAAFFSILLVYCVWIFTFPVFPTQDGPVHLYYATVIRHLAEHSKLFGNYFLLKFPPPPYILHYVILFLLLELLPAVTAEKIVIALSICLFCVGARFLLKSISSDYSLLSLLILPLSLNGMIGLGFYNYCLSLGLSFFAIGCWLRATYSSRVVFKIGFLGLLLLMLFTHPVPVLVTLTIITCHFITKIWQGWRNREAKSIANLAQAFKFELIVLLLAYSAVLYIALFVSTGRSSASFHHPWIQTAMLQDFITARPLMLVNGRLRADLFRGWLFFLLAAVTVFGVTGVVKNLRKGVLTTANLFSLVGLTGLLLYPLVPRTINGSDYFADRMVVYLWVFAIAGCSGQLSKTSRWMTPAALAAMMAALGVVAVNDSTLREISQHLARLENPAIRSAGSRGISIEVPLNPAAQTTFAPFFWAGTTYFRATNTVMMNSPWLELKISPLAPKSGLFTHLLPPHLVNFPYRILHEMDESAEYRKLVAKQIDFMVLSGSVESLKTDGGQSDRREWLEEWSCQKDKEFWLCRPPPQ